MQDDERGFVALGADRGDPAVHPTGDDGGGAGAVGRNRSDDDLGQVALLRGDTQPFEPVVAKRTQLLDVRVSERQPAMAARHQMVHPHLADGQVQVAQCSQLRAAEVNLGYAGRGDGRQRVAGEREHAGDGDRVQVGDRVDDVAVVVGLELQRQDDAVARQRGRQPAADLHRQFAQSDPRHDVQHDAAAAHGQVPGSQVGPVP